MTSGVAVNHSPETVAKAKRLVETDKRPISALAGECGMSRGMLWRLIHAHGWKHDAIKRESWRGQKIPDDLPYWRFRIYKKINAETRDHASALAVAQAAPLPKYMEART